MHKDYQKLIQPDDETVRCDKCRTSSIYQYANISLCAEHLIKSVHRDYDQIVSLRTYSMIIRAIQALSETPPSDFEVVWHRLGRIYEKASELYTAVNIRLEDIIQEIDKDE